ncbi:helix-turn-helix domain-containing protein [Luteimonas sp. TWI662]|uniref:helix-turn-helix domain-containing protein n=1 Tax=Luteimonas sp. TWI662 TaxID=3136789 RepID=UPI00320BA21B
MKVTLRHSDELGPLVRATRKHQGMRQDDTAESIGVSENFLAKVERGGGTVQWEKLFQVLTELGLRVEIDVPDAAWAQLQTQEKKREAQS